MLQALLPFFDEDNGKQSIELTQRMPKRAFSNSLLKNEHEIKMIDNRSAFISFVFREFYADLRKSF